MNISIQSLIIALTLGFQGFAMEDGSDFKGSKPHSSTVSAPVRSKTTSLDAQIPGDEPAPVLTNISSIYANRDTPSSPKHIITTLLGLKKKGDLPYLKVNARDVFKIIFAHLKRASTYSSYDHNMRITNAQLLELLSHKENVKKLFHMNLIFTEREDISVDVAITLAQRCPQLLSLHLSCYRNNIDAPVIALAQGCPQVEKVRVSVWDDAYISDASVIALAEGCSRLREVSLGRSSNITDASVIALAKGCRQLEMIYIYGARITVASINALAKECIHLRVLRLEPCSDVTDAAVIGLAKNNPNFEWLTYNDYSFRRVMTERDMLMKRRYDNNNRTIEEEDIMY